MNRMILLIVIAAVTLIMNIVSFCLMASDKKRAKAGRWRIPERTLFLAAGLFGGLGGLLGMKILRHKTQHWYFRVFFPIFFLLQAAVLVVLFICTA